MSTATYYSIIRYVPDPVRGEQVNIGALAVHGDGTFASVRFDRRFDRARSLGRGADVGFLRDFRDDLEELATEQSTAQLPLPARGQRAVAVTIEGKPRLDLDFLKFVSERWANSIQFTEPRASLEPDAERLLDEVFTRYVSADPTAGRRRGRDRRWIVSRAAALLEKEVAGRLPAQQATTVVRRNRELEGAIEPHVFELVLEHQEIRHAAHAISFEGGDKDSLKRDVESTAWLLDDTRKARPNLPLSVLVIERTGSPEMHRAEHICQALDVRFVRTSQVEEWAARAAQELVLA
jgi:hypothetical protein